MKGEAEMKRVLIALVAVGLFATVLSGTTFAGGPGNSDAAKACQKDGYKSLYRTDGSGFKNTGDCVSYAAQGGTLQTKCQPGSWSPTGVTPCTPASVGFYVPTAGATSQTPCPSGQTTSGTGSTSIAACHPIPCSPGSWSATGNVPCTAAGVGFYVSVPHAMSQTACPAGATTAGTGSTSIADCNRCIGENYDVDGNLNNGCEHLQAHARHTQGTASFNGSFGACDAPQFITGSLYSDIRTHAPTPAAFNSFVGSAPEWYSVIGTGAGFFCFNDYAVTFTTTGGPSVVGCYRLTIVTDHGPQSVVVNGHGTATMSDGPIPSAYSSGSTIWFEVEKICSLPITEAVNYTISYHL
jgi:hypothetical protein